MQYAAWVTEELKKIHDYQKACLKKLLEGGASIEGDSTVTAIKNITPLMDKLLSENSMSSAWKALTKQPFLPWVKNRFSRYSKTKIIYQILASAVDPVRREIPAYYLMTDNQRNDKIDDILKKIDELKMELRKTSVQVGLYSLIPREALDSAIKLEDFLVDTLAVWASEGKAWQNMLQEKLKKSNDEAEKCLIMEDMKHHRKRIRKILKLRPNSIDRDAALDFLKIVEEPIERLNRSLGADVTTIIFSELKNEVSAIKDTPNIFPKPTLCNNEINWFCYQLRGHFFQYYEQQPTFPIWSVISTIASIIFDNHGFNSERAKTQTLRIMKSIKRSDSDYNYDFYFSDFSFFPEDMNWGEHLYDFGIESPPQ